MVYTRVGRAVGIPCISEKVKTKVYSYMHKGGQWASPSSPHPGEYIYTLLQDIHYIPCISEKVKTKVYSYMYKGGQWASPSSPHPGEYILYFSIYTIYTLYIWKVAATSLLNILNINQNVYCILGSDIESGTFTVHSLHWLEEDVNKKLWKNIWTNFNCGYSDYDLIFIRVL